MFVSDTAQQGGPADTGFLLPARRARGGQAGGTLRRVGLVFLRQRESTVFVVAVALFIYFAVASTSFVTGTNLPILFTSDSSPYIIIALGEVFLLICGEIDLSVGFTFALAPFLMYFLNSYDHVPGLLAILIALLMGVVIGWINGFLTVTVGLPSFITTLGTGFVLLGIMQTTSHGEPVSVPPTWPATCTGSAVTGRPFIWAVVLTIIMHIVLTRTRWGLHTVSVGGNLLGAREAGINVDRIKYGNFMLTGLFGALVGVQNAFIPSPSTRRPAVTADVLRRDGGGHRRYRDARRNRDDHRRLPRRDRTSACSPTASHPGRQRQPAADHLRRRHPRRHDRQRSARAAAGKGSAIT